MVSTLRGDPARRHLRILVISGLDSGTIASLGLPSDIPVFAKPVPFARLQTAVRAALQARSAC